MDIGADEDEETSVDVQADEVEENTPTDPEQVAQVPARPLVSKTQVMTSRNGPAERPSRIPGLRFRVQSDPVGQSITPRPRKTAIDTLPPGVGPGDPENLPLRAEKSVSAPRPTSVPPPPPSTSAADLNYQRILQLRRELRAIKTLQNKHERELVALRARAEIFEEQILNVTSAAKGAAQSAADQPLLRKVALLEDRTVIQQSAISEAHATNAARFADLSQRVEAIEVSWARRSVSSAGVSAVNDLKRIKGIGPKFEMLLHDAGVTTFEQISAWSDEDVARVAEQVGTTPSRIERDGWIQSAKKLAGKQ